MCYPSHVMQVGSFHGAEGIGHIGGLHTTAALLLAVFEPIVAAANVTGHLEKLAKAIKRDHDKLLLPQPGVL
jgi:hypothetical protein